jgi:hypothetical protein
MDADEGRLWNPADPAKKRKPRKTPWAKYDPNWIKSWRKRKPTPTTRRKP